MPVFIGMGCRTLIVEQDDTIAEQFSRSLLRFPNSSTLRVRTKQEAVDRLAEGDEIHQVCIDGRVWTIPQALEILKI